SGGGRPLAAVFRDPLSLHAMPLLQANGYETPQRRWVEGRVATTGASARGGVEMGRRCCRPRKLLGEPHALHIDPGRAQRASLQPWAETPVRAPANSGSLNRRSEVRVLPGPPEHFLTSFSSMTYAWVCKPGPQGL